MDLVQTKESKELSDIYNKAKEEIKAATEILNDAKAKLIKLADGNKSNISGVLVYPIERQGTVQYKNIPELNGVNLDDYRGKSTTSWGVK